MQDIHMNVRHSVHHKMHNEAKKQARQSKEERRRGELKKRPLRENRDPATLCWETERLSKNEHRVDALALRAEERRDKLRKAAGRSKYPMISGYLNVGTHMERLHVSMTE